MSAASNNIESTLHEERVFAPAAEFSARSRFGSMEDYERLRAEAETAPDAFWARMAEELHWFKPWDTVLEWKPPHAEVVRRRQDRTSPTTASTATSRRGGATRRRSSGRASRARQRTLTYQQLHREVCRFANVLKRSASRRATASRIYMPLVPELAIAMLACARIGAAHSRRLRRLLAPRRCATASTTPRRKLVITADGG